jgi:hypothetical protein
MSREKRCQLRIVSGHILLIGEECGIVRDDRGERGAQLEQADDLSLRGCDVLVVEYRRGRCRRRRGGPLRLGEERGAAKEYESEGELA